MNNCSDIIILIPSHYGLGVSNGNCLSNEMRLFFMLVHRRTERCDYDARPALLQ